MLISIIIENNVQGQLAQKILLLFVNCAQENKANFLGNDSLHSLIMTILTTNQFSKELKALASQLIVNLIYKCNSAI